MERFLGHYKFFMEPSKPIKNHYIFKLITNVSFSSFYFSSKSFLFKIILRFVHETLSLLSAFPVWKSKEMLVWDRVCTTQRHYVIKLNLTQAVLTLLACLIQQVPSIWTYITICVIWWAWVIGYCMLSVQQPWLN